jgi:hypothetical protein
VKLDKRHMIVSVVLLVGSIIYNAWVFTGGSKTTVATPRPAGGVAQTLPGGGSPAGSDAIDPSQVRALPDVALDRLPEWPRNPFQNPSLPVDVGPIVENPSPAPVPEADPVVGTILYSSDRKAAVVDGHVVRVGDAIGTAKVVEILPKAVIIESPDRGRRTLELKPGPRTAPSAR